MIVDRLENWRHYFTGPAWTRVFGFLASLTPDAESGVTHIDNEAIYARVMSYETRGPDDAVLETHEQYVDVQMALAGAEGIDWFPKSGLEVKTPYDAVTDVTFYHRPGVSPAHVDVHPGTFAVFFPEDAHMPQLVVGDAPAEVKKVVVKVHVDRVT